MKDILRQMLDRIRTLRLSAVFGKKHDEAGTCEEREEREAARAYLSVIAVFFVSLIGFIIWAACFTLDIASIAPGEVVPVGRVKSVQHLEGGIVEAIHVEEGDRVTKGMPLVDLVRVASESELGELEARMAALKVDIARLNAQLEGRETLDVEDAIGGHYPDLVQTKQRLLISEIGKLASAVQNKKDGMELVRRDIAAAQTQAQNSQGRINLLSRQIEISKKLMRDKLTNEYEHLNLLKEYQSAIAARDEAKAKAARSNAQLVVERSAIDKLEKTIHGEWRKELADANQHFQEFQERANKLKDNESRTTIRSPVDGVVLARVVSNPGMVVQPGGTVLTLVPEDTGIVIEAKLAVGDIGFVSMGQTAKVQLASSAGAGFRPLSGKVVSISADAFRQDHSQPPFYRVQIAVQETAFRKGDLRYALVPGVPVTVSILTGYRSVLAYILAPLNVNLRLSLSER